MLYIISLAYWRCCYMRQFFLYLSFGVAFRQILKKAVMDSEAMKKRGAMDCIECGLCTYVCPSRIDVTENVRKAKRTLAAAKK